MTHKLLTTTALIALLTSSAVADNHTVLSTDLDATTSTETNVDTNDTSLDATTNVDANADVKVEANDTETVTDEVNNTTSTSVDATAKASSTMGDASVTMSGEAVLASNLIGKKVYGSASADADEYGDVNDIVMDEDGNTDWIIVGVGGFLGLGEKEVALSVDTIDWVERDGERIVVTNTTKAELEAATALDRDALMNSTEYNESSFSWTDEGKKRIEELKSWDWEHAQLQVVGSGDISVDSVIGARVYGPNRDDLGEVSDVLMNEQGELTAYIVDVGGFLGLGEKPVALSTNRIHVYQSVEGDMSVRSDFTQEELENGPTYSEAEYKANADMVIVQ